MDPVAGSIAWTAPARSAAEERALLRDDTFDELVRLHQKRVFRVLYSLLRDQDAADSLTQDCFLRAYQYRAGFRGECRVDTWLIRIAVNLATDHLRNRRRAFWKLLLRRGKDEQPDAAAEQLRDTRPAVDQVLVARDEAAAIWSAAAELPVQQRTVFLLRFAEDMSLDEIAAATRLELGTVKSHLHRALAAVRKKFGERQQK